MSWAEDYTITLDLAKGGKVSVTSHGTRRDHSMTSTPQGPYNTEDRFTWTTRWRGTRTTKKGARVLTLDLVTHTCKGERDDNGAVTAKVCKTPSKKATLTCTSSALEVSSGTRATKTDAWLCSRAEGTDLAESSGPWTFPKAGCLAVHGGQKAAYSYARCQP